MANDTQGLMEDKSRSKYGAIVLLSVGGLGMAAIFAAKQFGLTQIEVTIIPVALMAGYALLIRIPRLRLRDDQSGDNLYYLGFLYTLTSMATALYEFTKTSDATTIVANFGVAISTTILGIILRISFNQLRTDTVDVERVARMELADASRRLRSELDNSILELKQFHRANLQSSEEAYTAVRRMTEETLRSLIDDSTKFATQTAQAVEVQNAGSVATVAKLQKSVTQVAESLDNISEQLDTFKDPRAIIKLELGPTQEKLDELLDELRNIHGQQVTGVEAALGSLHATAAGVQTIVASTHSLISDLAPLVEALHHLDQRVRVMEARPQPLAPERRWTFFGSRQET